MTEKTKSDLSKPELNNSFAQKELDKAEGQFNKFESDLNELASKRSYSPTNTNEHSLSQNQINSSKDIYLKPKRVIACKEKFNEKFQTDYDFDKEFVCFTAVNNEIIGETIDLWTRPYPGLPAEEWSVPCNKPVWGPRYLAEQIKRKGYHRFTMANQVVSSDSTAQYYGSMAVDTFVQRLDAMPVTKRKSLFGSSGF